MSPDRGFSFKAILALSDDELIDLLKKHQEDINDTDILVNDLPDIDSSDGQEMCKRVLTAQQLLQARKTTMPLDVGKLDEILAAIGEVDRTAWSQLAVERPTSPNSRSDTSHETPDAVESAVVAEKEAYDNLIKDGGRPLYPIQMIEQISGNPQQYRDLLQPFWKHPEPHSCRDWEVFQRQWRQRQTFRNWQLHNRGIIVEEDFDAHVQERKDYLTKYYGGRGVAEIEANPESLKKPGRLWDLRQKRKNKDRGCIRESRCSNFAEYHAALKKRLSAHGFKEQVSLQQDLTRQDSLQEWYEYLGFECWCQDKYLREYERHKIACDEKWKYIQSQSWVASHETPEHLGSWDGIEERYARVSEAQKHVDEAKLLVGCVRQRIDTGDASVSTSRQLDEALEKLAQAEAEYKDADHRNHTINTLGNHIYACEEAKAAVDSQPALIQWILDQFPLIKSEMEAKATGGVAALSNTKKRARADETDAEEKGRPIKRKAKEKEEENVKVSKEPSLIPQNRRGSRSGQDSAAVAQPRRSARIAAQQKKVAGTIPEQKESTKKALQTEKRGKKEERKDNSTQVEAGSGRESRGRRKRAKPALG
ncbi:hypothetical protein CCM_02986 [Cordyceps militaris CM01]|uniref:Uncharacterized protein n=1 Tax=Cordyceps militaris (strain CM01) TaxID=983644 RepID=G3J876_CORMM|nr:uncharacterized protein CCM_02986 [Cordyceps militaris CM01]EGX94715.1 hypothetical protein CCM_02986 [Cordyceps militaris CM01]